MDQHHARRLSKGDVGTLENLSAGDIGRPTGGGSIEDDIIWHLSNGDVGTILEFMRWRYSRSLRSKTLLDHSCSDEFAGGVSSVVHMVVFPELLLLLVLAEVVPFDDGTEGVSTWDHREEQLPGREKPGLGKVKRGLVPIGLNCDVCPAEDGGVRPKQVGVINDDGVLAREPQEMPGGMSRLKSRSRFGGFGTTKCPWFDDCACCCCCCWSCCCCCCWTCCCWGCTWWYCGC
mmetsp:Transcript_1629/g.3661  ORF Transcript_1629/g.3661 Transcript_1629/m.3661 type:complete len:232 (+) Transcript_1629:189-884(+)